jgi:hypothetical protein
MDGNRRFPALSPLCGRHGPAALVLRGVASGDENRMMIVIRDRPPGSH